MKTTAFGKKVRNCELLQGVSFMLSRSNLSYYLYFVRLWRLLISLVLLVVHTVGFAYHIVPHCDLNCSKEYIEDDSRQSHHHHEHHKHAAPDHDHIAHNDHLVSGLFDYMFCLLSELEHPGTNCGESGFVFSSTVGIALYSSENWTAVPHPGIVSTADPERDPFTIYEVLALYDACANTEHPHRGPPTFAC